MSCQVLGGESVRELVRINLATLGMKVQFSRRELAREQIFEILYFLLSAIDPKGTKRHFQAAWPLVDRDQHRHFIDLVVEKLGKLRCVEPGLIKKSVISSQGKPLLVLLLDLSNYVMELRVSELSPELMERISAVRPRQLPEQLQPTMDKLLKSNVVLMQSRVKNYCGKVDKIQEEWETMSATMLKELNETEEQLKQLDGYPKETFRVSEDCLRELEAIKDMYEEFVTKTASLGAELKLHEPSTVEDISSTLGKWNSQLQELSIAISDNPNLSANVYTINSKCVENLESYSEVSSGICELLEHAPSATPKANRGRFIPFSSPTDTELSISPIRLHGS